MMAVGLGCVFKRQLFPICVCVCVEIRLAIWSQDRPPFFGVAGSGQLPLVFSPSLTNWQYLTALARSLFWPPVYTAPWRTVIKFPCVVFRLIFHQRVVLGQKKRNHFQSWYLAFWTLCVCRWRGRPSNWNCIAGLKWIWSWVQRRELLPAPRPDVLRVGNEAHGVPGARVTLRLSVTADTVFVSPRPFLPSCVFIFLLLQYISSSAPALGLF